MCVGIPVKIIQSGEFVSVCQGRNGREDVNMMLIGPQQEGTWVLNFLGSAREVLSEKEALQINKALDGLSAIMSGQEIEVKDYFPDVEPQ
jgi:hydrogenase expression/formation protein HypC